MKTDYIPSARQPQRQSGALVGLWLVRVQGESSEGPMLARVHDDLYALAFSTAPRASTAMAALGMGEGRPFYVLDVNHDRTVRDLKSSGAVGFIVDYDASRATFASALPLPLLDVA